MELTHKVRDATGKSLMGGGAFSKILATALQAMVSLSEPQVKFFCGSFAYFSIFGFKKSNYFILATVLKCKPFSKREGGNLAKHLLISHKSTSSEG